MDAPIARLPPELLVVVFEELESEEVTLCAMVRKRWRSLIKNLRPYLTTDPDRLMNWAAWNSNPLLMKLAKKWGNIVMDDSFSWVEMGDIRISSVVEATASKGYIECLKLAKEWIPSASNDPEVISIFMVALSVAARWGHIDCMKILKGWDNFCAERFVVVLLSAARGGHIDCMELVKKWEDARDLDFKLLIAYAAKEGRHPECIPLAKKWKDVRISDHDLNTALEYAAEEGHLECMKLLKKWGATQFKWALERAAKGSQIESMKLVKEWSKGKLRIIDYNKALQSARGTETIKLLKQWRAEAEAAQ